MKRCAAVISVLVGVLLLPCAAVAANSSGQASGTVIGVAGHTLGLEVVGGRMPVIAALRSAADGVTAGDFPYVYGGGHGQAGIASIGLKGPGYNGHRIGFDCSGSVAAVLSQAGLWPVAAGVPSDAGVISELLHEHLIARGRGHGASEVTLYDDWGVHIFMDIGGRFFGTSDGGGGGNPNGGAGWLDDGAPDASSRQYKPYHLVSGVLRQQTSLERILTFTVPSRRRAAAITHGLMLGSAVHVGYTVAPNGNLVAQSVS
jgi:hypothetical protein